MDKDLVDFCNQLGNKIIKKQYRCQVKPETQAKLNSQFTHKEN